MILLNKKLIYILVVLIPISIISFFLKETNFIMQKNQQYVEEISVPVKIDNKTISLDLEEYVIGVVAGEMPALFEIEALKAQAVAARTYLVNHLLTNDTITSTISNQVYITKDQMKEKWSDNFESYYEKIKNAVLATKDLIMYYDEKPIKAYYFSTSNGYTESSINVFNEQTDYLTIVKSPFDENNSHTITISKEEFCTKLKLECNNIKINNIEKDESNRIKNININNKTYTGIEIRKKLSLRSTDFEFKVEKDNIIITTKGYGHGVGMSQYGANNMAKLGYTYEEILKYYYQNIEIKSI